MWNHPRNHSMRAGSVPQLFRIKGSALPPGLPGFPGSQQFLLGNREEVHNHQSSAPLSQPWLKGIFHAEWWQQEVSKDPGR